MQGMRLKLIAAADPDVFQDRLNRFIEGLSDETMIVDIKFSTSTTASQTMYAALVQYKQVESWAK